MSAAGIDGHELVRRYEALRQAIVQRDAAHRDVRSIALLTRQGVAGWMHAVAADAAASPSEPSSTSRVNVAVPSSSLEQSFVNIVVAMALGHAREVVA